MIPVIDVVQSLRYALGDMQGLNISDYELIELINQAVSKLYGHLSQRYVHATIKRKEGINIDPTADLSSVNPLREYELPEEFVRIHQVLGMVGDRNYYRVLVPSSTNPPPPGSYRIVGTTFYAPKGVYNIEYYYIPSRVYTLEGLLDMQASLKSWVEQIAVALHKKDYATVNELALQCEAAMAGREVSHFENTSATQILGGRI